MKKTIKLTEADLTRIIKRVIKESKESNSNLEILNYIDDNFTPDGGWNNSETQDMFGGESPIPYQIIPFYVNNQLEFVYHPQDPEQGDNNFLIVGPNMFQRMDKIFGKNIWFDEFRNWFEKNTGFGVDEVEKDDFKGMYSDYVKPSSRDTESNFMFYMEELGEYANQLDWEGLDIEGEEMEHFVDDIYQIVHNAKQDDTLTEDEIDEIEGFAAGIVSRLD